MKYFVYNKLTQLCDVFTDASDVGEYVDLHRNTIANHIKKDTMFEHGAFVIGEVRIHKSKRHGKGFPK